MSVADMLRVCTVSGAAIVVGMLLLGAMMIYQKPEARLELLSMSDAPVKVEIVPIVPRERPLYGPVDVAGVAKDEPSL